MFNVDLIKDLSSMFNVHSIINVTTNAVNKITDSTMDLVNKLVSSVFSH